MNTIKFFSDYADSATLLQNFLAKYHILDNTLKYTLENNYDFAVVFNRTNEPIIKSAKIITIIQEPSWHEVHKIKTFLKFSDYLVINDAKLFEDVHQIKLGGKIIESPSFMFFYDQVERGFFDGVENVKKEKKISMIVSGLSFTFANYRKRLRLLQDILSSDLDIDIYGRGLSINDPRYKGPLQHKYSGLIPYEYSIAIENSNEKNYITEKFIDCILCNTQPIYNGAPNVAEVYDPRFFKTIDLESQTIIDDIKDIIKVAAQSSIVNKEIYFKRYNLYNLLKDIIVKE